MQRLTPAQQLLKKEGFSPNTTLRSEMVLGEQAIKKLKSLQKEDLNLMLQNYAMLATQVEVARANSYSSGRFSKFETLSKQLVRKSFFMGRKEDMRLAMAGILRSIQGLLNPNVSKQDKEFAKGILALVLKGESSSPFGAAAPNTNQIGYGLPIVLSLIIIFSLVGGDHEI